MNHHSKSMEAPSVAVIGIGGVGGYLSAVLSASYPHVSVVARGDRHEILQKNGIVLHSDKNGEITGHPERIVRTIGELGVQDVIFVCVKNYSLDDVISQLPAAVGPDTLVIPVMNGIDPGERIRKGLACGRVADAVIYIVSYLLPDGSVVQEGTFADIRVGMPDADEVGAAQLERIAALMTDAGFSFRISENVTLDIWRKFVLNSGFNVGTAYHDAPIGALRKNPEWAQEYEDLTTEAWTVGRAAGVPLLQEDLDGFLQRFREEYRDDASSSLQRDMHAGRQSEMETFCGYVVRKAVELGVDVPVTRRVYGDIFRKQVEKSIRKKFRKPIWCNFTKAINRYDMVKPGDVIGVCISGGKDSMLMAKLFQELKLHNKFPFEVKFLVMDPGYSPANRQLIEENAAKLGVPVHIFESQIFDSVFHIEKSPCYLCARMRRGYLYNFARQLGCNKIALGHHYDDVIETILMGMLWGAQIQTMMPKLHSTNFEGMELIRPMYLVREEDIKAWRDYNHLQFLRCACKFTESCGYNNENEENLSKRLEVKALIAQMKQTNPEVENHIFKSVENVHLDTIIAYKKDGQKVHFLDHYDENKGAETE